MPAALRLTADPVRVRRTVIKENSVMKSRKAFTLIELLVVVAIIALLISILLPSLSRARELSKRLVCGTQAKGYGTAVKIYANDNEEHWPTPTFDEDSAAVVEWRRTLVEIGFGGANGLDCDDAVVPPPNNPDRQSISEDNANLISVTRAMWMLVRSGEVTPKSFICPSSGDQIENNQNVDCYYDFESDKRVSYGFQVPFGPFQTRGSEDVDPRMAVFSDHGPYSRSTTSTVVTPLPATDDDWSTDINDPGKDMSPQSWQTYNSPNHGGNGTGEGQNVLFGDGHASFHKNPLQGIDNDNIFTLMGADALGEARQSGFSPEEATGGPGMYPGKNVFSGSIGDSTTDSLIYP
jgi:prepilin-type N-terminal cleavage/methylation domain-containing protein/prepilin-type processing-associated H-X9-DG protein